MAGHRQDCRNVKGHKFASAVEQRQGTDGGGGEPGGGGVDNTAELYDPSTGQWTRQTGSMNHARSMASMVKLLDGRVLIIGDGSHPGHTSMSEIYDPGERAVDRGRCRGGAHEDGDGGSAVLLNDMGAC